MSSTPSNARSKAARERSAGVIVFIETTGIRLYLLLNYGSDRRGKPHWDFPKGHVESGETDLTAALRELHEETAIADCQILPGFSREITYYFRAKGKLVRKDVIFFLGQTQIRDVKISDEHVGFEFLPYDQTLARLRFPSARELLRLAEERVRVAEPG